MPHVRGARRAQSSRTRKRHRRSTGEWSDGDSNHSDVEADRLWACPFYKLDPWTHYRCMEKYKFKRYADVKQHIIRRHTRRGSHCLSEDEAAALKTMPPDRDDLQKWYRMWDKIFDGHQRPSSPYISHGIAEPMALLRTHAKPLLVVGLPSLLEELRIYVDANMIALLQTGIEHMVFEAPSSLQCDRLRPRSNALGAGRASLQASPNGHLHNKTVQIGSDPPIPLQQTPAEHPPSSPDAVASNKVSTDMWTDIDTINLFSAMPPFDQSSLFDSAAPDGQSGDWNGTHPQF